MLTFCVKTVHHALHDIQLVLNGEVDEVGVNENVVRWSQLCVILEEQGGGDLWTVRNKGSDNVRRSSRGTHTPFLTRVSLFLLLLSFSSGLLSPGSSFCKYNSSLSTEHTHT